jgi:hypothetical protein
LYSLAIASSRHIPEIKRAAWLNSSPVLFSLMTTQSVSAKCALCISNDQDKPSCDSVIDSTCEKCGSSFCKECTFQLQSVGTFEFIASSKQFGMCVACTTSPRDGCDQTCDSCTMVLSNWELLVCDRCKKNVCEECHDKNPSLFETDVETDHYTRCSLCSIQYTTINDVVARGNDVFVTVIDTTDVNRPIHHTPAPLPPS